MRILSDSNTKAQKSRALGWYTLTLELLPHKKSGINVCQYSDGCELTCLDGAGRGRFGTVYQNRLARTHLLFSDWAQFWTRFDGELYEHIEMAEKLGLRVCVRMNTLSDLPWWRMIRPGGQNVFDAWQDVQFYDYTKRPLAEVPYHLDNYHVTKSWGASSTADTLQDAKNRGVNVAVVFQGQLPKRFNGHYVINGDKTDLRFLDKTFRIVGLRQKSTPNKQAGVDSGFIQIDKAVA
jgi:hypothetical protein